jgi:hypothetical protein
MQFFMLIPNIMSILLKDKNFVVKISKYDPTFWLFLAILPLVWKK